MVTILPVDQVKRFSMATVKLFVEKALKIRQYFAEENANNSAGL